MGLCIRLAIDVLDPEILTKVGYIIDIDFHYQIKPSLVFFLIIKENASLLFVVLAKVSL